MEGPYLVLYNESIFVVTPFDYKDENSFRFSLFVDVRFKLCSVLNLDTSMKHSLLFRNTWHDFFVP